MDPNWGILRQRVRNFANRVVRPSSPSRSEDIEAGLENLPSSTNPTIFINVRSGESDTRGEADDEEIRWNSATLYLALVKPTLVENLERGRKGKH